MTLPHGAAAPIRSETLIDAHERAVEFYRAQLFCHVGVAARDYLAGRALDWVLCDAAARWAVGFASPGWTGLVDHLGAAAFSNEELLAAGLAVPTRRGGVVDRFRNRVMLPIRDEHGSVVAFIGRALPGAAADAPKYLNSPDTAAYRKQESLYGLWEHRDALTAGDSAVVVEGPLDVLAIAAAADTERVAVPAVSPCGTALTTGQAAALFRRLNPVARVVVAFDADAAGRGAAAAAYEVLRGVGPGPMGRSLLAARLPDGLDPAELLRQSGPSALLGAVARSEQQLPLARLAIDARLEAWGPALSGVGGRVAAVRSIARLIADLPPAQVTAEVLRLAQTLDLHPATVSAALIDEIAPESAPAAGHRGLRGPAPAGGRPAPPRTGSWRSPALSR